MNIKQMKTEELIPYENNPRFNEEAIDKVAESIKEFGFKVPIIIDSNNVIVAGHTRQLSAKKLGMEQVPVIVADDLSDSQIKAFRLADNRVAEFSEWDFELMYKELNSLDIDMEAFGFEEELPDIDIDDVFGEEIETVKVNKLKWNGGVVEINQSDNDILTDKLTDYKSHERREEFSFVEYLLAGGDDAALFGRT